MRTIVLLSLLLHTASLLAQSDRRVKIKFNTPTYPVDYAITNPLKNTVARVKVTYTGDGYEKEYEYTPLYLNKQTKDFTIVDEKIIVSFDASEQSFFLNQIYEDGKALLPENSSFKTNMESQDEEHVFLTWNIGLKELTVTFWLENLEKVLADK